MNSDTLKGQWRQLQGEVKKQWGELTDDDVDRIDGECNKFVGAVQESYGIERDEAERRLREWNPPL